MFTLLSLRWLYRSGLPLRYLAPGMAALISISAAFMPWLKDPFGTVYTGWTLPIYVGWYLHSRFLNYGVLCLCTALYSLLVCFARRPLLRLLQKSSWRSLAELLLKERYGWAGFFCCIPFLLFLLQYLYIDVQGINMIAQHKAQTLLIQQHLGYGLLSQRLPISPFTMDISTISGRFSLLANQASFGALIPLLAAGITWSYRQRALVPSSQRIIAAETTRERWGKRLIWLAIVLPFLCLLGRVPVADICEAAASNYLNAGNYEQASWWWDKALRLNPDIDQLTYYHVQRGQIRYFLHHDDVSDESIAYLAYSEYQHGNYETAYQRLFGVWTAHKNVSWVVNEIDQILARQAESKRPLGNVSDPEFTSSQEDSRALPALQLLLQIDPANVYGHYVIGRIDYELHAYVDCTQQMVFVAQAISNRDLQSSAYTYIGLSEAGQGDYVDSRTFLLKAIMLDPNYYNNTAREELSGLH
ncbi:hypothetical protein [Tengunoibacter tsumagoiensis]|uniref:Tetratricopeptide repeat protein n=1 Tax=Tengunoibacter tsumagoiensis TaxID=2014871 RepID=A0A401ZVF3_9CHLR|nr:hypothetical protein [Tengunoibacter tsumagoiensis]GCE10908.1 hypothetical protein KTT_07670 [Tengunoibacter tsumagoiensis]